MVYRYLRRIDTFQNNHIHCFLTGGNVKFMLLMNPDPSTTTYSSYQASPPSRPSTARQSTGLLAANPTSQQTEDAVRQFMFEVSASLCLLAGSGERSAGLTMGDRCMSHG